MVGHSFEILVEGLSKKDASRITGRTRTNKIVHVPGTGLAPGRFLDAFIETAHPHHLDGVLA
jgi:tRNA-2-methylthio-N6-dimethylallyladenosine synthase